MKKFIINETKESFSSIHELRQHALFEQIKDYTLIVREDKKMTEGISKEMLLDFDPWAYDNQQDLLNAILKQCTELNPWLQINKDTPKDRRLLLFWKAYGSFTGSWRMNQYFCDAGLMVPVNIEPTHWQELPEDPK